jgi:opacity protein-like surface antigen
MDISDDTTTTVNIPIGPGIPVTTSASADQTSWIVHLVGGYNLLTDGGSWLDLTAGVRYLEIDSNVDLTLAVLGPGQSVTLSESDSVWDGIIGLKGRVALGERWHLPYYFDIGTGDSDFTWQAIVGVSFQATKSVNVAFVYRHLEWEFASDSLVNDLYFSGPALGVTFHF